MAWDIKKQTMYFVDTYRSTISEFRTDDQGIPVRNSSGKYERREVVKVPQEEGIPDGMTIDRQATCSETCTALPVGQLPGSALQRVCVAQCCKDSGMTHCALAERSKISFQ